MKHFFVRPMESLMFGPPRSFAAGEAHRSASLFPPSPYAFQGLVRTRLLHSATSSIDLDDPGSSKGIEALVGSPDALKAGWQITGPYPAHRRTDDAGENILSPWFPAPRFLQRSRNNEILSVRPITNVQPGRNDLDESLLLGRPEVGPCETLSGWISTAALKDALSLGTSPGALKWSDDSWQPDLPSFVQREFQPGLAIHRGARVVQEGLLYFVEALRFGPESGMWARLASPASHDFEVDALETDIGAFGRKGRVVHFESAQELDADWNSVLAGEHLPKTVQESERFWLVTLSPIRVANAFTLRPREALPDGVSMKIDAALTGSPVALGGFSLTRGAARPNRLYVPAGSSWAIRLLGGTPRTRAQALRTIHDAHPFGPPEEAAMGFGHILVGRGPSGTGDET